MHRCLNVQGWVRVWGDPEAEGRQLSTCTRCTPHRRDLPAWLAAVRQCPECSAALETIPLAADDVLNCPQCMDAFGKLHEILDELEHFDPVVALEAATAEELFSRLDKLSAAEAVARVTDDLAYQQWGLCQRLLSASRQRWCSEPGRARDYAAVAVAVADRLHPESYNGQWVSDLRAKAHAFLGNTYRILAAFQQAEREYLLAEYHLRRGTGADRFQAQVFSLKASLLVDRECFIEADAVLGKVEAIYRRAGEARELVRTRLKLAMAAAGREDYHRAAETCNRAAEELDPQEDRVMAVLAQQNAVEYLTLAGDLAEARACFSVLPPPEGRSMALRRRWVEGNLLRAEGSLMRALDAYHEARAGYLQEDRHYYAALISLEEALTAFELDDVEAVAMRAEEASILLVKAAAKHQALAVLRLLLAAVERGTVDRAMLVAVARKIAALKPS